MLNAVSPRVTFIGSSTRGPFTLVTGGVNIRVQAGSDLRVTRFASVTDEVGTVLVLDTDFTCNNTDQDAVTVSLTMAQAVLTSTQRLLVERIQVPDNTLSLSLGGDFSGPALAAAIDKHAEYLQELRRDVDRAIKASALDTTPSAFPLKSNMSEGYVLGIDGSKNIVPIDPSTLVTAGGGGGGGGDDYVLPTNLASWNELARAAGFDDFAVTPSSAGLRDLLTDETGTGAAVFAGSPALTGAPTINAKAIVVGDTAMTGKARYRTRVKSDETALEYIRPDAFFLSDYANEAACWAAMVANGGGRIVRDQASTLAAPITAANVSFAMFNAGQSAAPITVANSTGGIFWSSDKSTFPNDYVYLDAPNILAAQASGKGISLVWPNGGSGAPAEPHCLIKDLRARPAAGYDGSTNRFTSPLYIENAQNARIVRPNSQFNGSPDTVHIDLNYGADSVAFAIFIDRPNLQSGLYGIRGLGWMENVQILGGECANNAANVLLNAAASNIPGDLNPVVTITGGHWNSTSRNFDMRVWKAIHILGVDCYINPQSYSPAQDVANAWIESCESVQVGEGSSFYTLIGNDGASINNLSAISALETNKIDIRGNVFLTNVLYDTPGRTYYPVIASKTSGAFKAVVKGNTFVNESGLSPVKPTAAMLIQGTGTSSSQVDVSDNTGFGAYGTGALVVNINEGVVENNKWFGNTTPTTKSSSPNVTERGNRRIISGAVTEDQHTLPSQNAIDHYNASIQYNVTGDGTDWTIIGLALWKLTGSVFYNSGTGVYTAQKAGWYSLSGCIAAACDGSSHNLVENYIHVSGGRNYILNRIQPRSGETQVELSVSQRFWLNLGDTFVVSMKIGGGSKNASLGTATSLTVMYDH